MTQQLEMIARYKQLRQITLPLNNRLVKSLTSREIDDGGRHLGIMKNGTLVFNCEDETSVLMDFCLHDVWHDGLNVIERFLAATPPPADSDEMLILQGKRAARYSIFMVESVQPGFGVHVVDLLYDDELFITDIGFGNSASIGSVIAFRLVMVDGINMTTGAALPIGVVPPDGREEFMRVFVSEFKKMVKRRRTPQEFSELTAMIISSCLAKGSATRIRYADPVENQRPRRRRHAPQRRAPVVAAKKKVIDREERCPCGSGRKYKNCCLGK
jgi:hypothetical protein